MLPDTLKPRRKRHKRSAALSPLFVDGPGQGQPEGGEPRSGPAPAARPDRPLATLSSLHIGTDRQHRAVLLEYLERQQPHLGESRQDVLDRTAAENEGLRRLKTRWVEDGAPAVPTLTYARGGASVKLHVPSGSRVVGGKRGVIREYSAASRRRMLHELNSVDRALAPADQWHFISLMQPGAKSVILGPREFKQQLLKAFFRKLAKQYPQAAGFWKMEPQRRLAAHAHLMIWCPGVPTLELLNWVAATWFEIAGQGDWNHLLLHCGMLKGSKPCVERLITWDGVTSYASKYMGKLITGAEAWESPGRWWGKFQRDNLPIYRVQEPVPEPAEVRTVERVMRSYARSRPTGKFVIRSAATGRVVEPGPHTTWLADPPRRRQLTLRQLVGNASGDLARKSLACLGRALAAKGLILTPWLSRQRVGTRSVFMSEASAVKMLQHVRGQKPPDGFAAWMAATSAG